MNWKKKKPSCGKQRRLRNRLHDESYRKPTPLSSFEITIGEFLFYLDENDKPNWQLLEASLRKFYEVNYDK